MTYRSKHVILLIAAIVIGLISSAGAVCPECNAAGCVCTSDTEATLLAGQNEEVGLVSVDLVKDASGNDAIDVTYTTSDGWLLEDAHLYVGTVPPTNSAPGSFPYKVENLGGVTAYTFQVPYPTGYVDPCGPQNDGTVVQDAFYLAPHGVVSKNGQEESTWANGTLIREKKNWAMYFGADINVECNDCPVAVNDAYEAVEDTELVVPAVTGILANDTDEEGNTITIVSNTQPEHGLLVLNADGSFSYLPEANFCGADSFSYNVTDGICDEPVSATGSINVACINDCPVAADDSASADEDGSVAIPVVANDQDIDNDPLSVGSFANGANGVVTQNGDGTLTYTPNANFCGTDTFTYNVTDGICDQASWDEGTVTVTVGCSNDAPDAADDSTSLDEDTFVIVPVLSNDADIDGDELAVESTTQPENGTVTNNGDGTVTYTPSADYCGPDSFTYIVSDGALTDTATVTIDVACVEDNVAPDAVDDEAEVNVGSSVLVSVLDNDVDADGDSLTIASITQPAAGTVVDNENGTVTYTSTGSSCDEDSFTYTVSDGQLTDTATVAVNVNCPPVAAIDGPYIIYPGVPLTVEAPGVLANDTDPDGDSLVVMDLDYLAQMGIDLTLNPDGSFTFLVPNDLGIGGMMPYFIFDRPGYGLEDVVNGNPDIEGHYDMGFIIIDIGSANEAPDAVDDAASVDQDSSVTVSVLANDVDADGDGLTIDSITQPVSGTATDNGDGTVTYTPDADYCGADSFEYTVTDGELNDTATVTVTVNCVAEPMDAVDDYYSTPANTVLGIGSGNNPNLYENDLGDGRITDMSLPLASHGTVGYSSLGSPGEGLYSYTPDAGYCGPDSFTYTITNGDGLSDTATVFIDVVCPANTCPVAVYDSYDTTMNTQLVVSSAEGVLANDIDDDGDTLQASLQFIMFGSVTLNPDGSFVYTPVEGFTGFDEFMYSVSDGDGGCYSEEVATINVS